MTGSDSPSSADALPAAPRPDRGAAAAPAGWHFWYSGPGTGAFQMATDLALLEARAAGRIGNVFRLYTWHPAAVSLGFHQEADREVDREAARRLGIDVVRRPTGGRAILHDDELTYAIVAGADDPHVGGRLVDSHARVSDIFRRALVSLGVPAVFAPTGGVEEAGRGGVAPPCFASATRTELVVGGRKLLGSAQRRFGDAFLQHGALLLGPAHLGLAGLLRLSPEGRERWRRKLDLATTTVTREAGRRPSLSELIAAIASAAGDAGLAETVRFVQEPPGR